MRFRPPTREELQSVEHRRLVLEQQLRVWELRAQHRHPDGPRAVADLRAKLAALSG
jgi:hypothetical protein